LWVITEKNKSLRLAGESIQMADGAKFLNATPNCWHKMLISYDIQSKLATFTLDGKDSKVVDLNQQPDKTYQLTPTSIVVKSLKAGIIKIKSIVISES
jgi:ureidoglycolate hydrolase